MSNFNPTGSVWELWKLIDSLPWFLNSFLFAKACAITLCFWSFNGSSTFCPNFRRKNRAQISTVDGVNTKDAITIPDANNDIKWSCKIETDGRERSLQEDESSSEKVEIILQLKLEKNDFDLHRNECFLKIWIKQVIILILNWTNWFRIWKLKLARGQSLFPIIFFSRFS